MSQAPNFAIMASNLLKEIIAHGAVKDPMAIPKHLAPVTNALRSLYAGGEEMGSTVHDLVSTMASSGQVTDPAQLLQVLQDFGASISEVGGQVAQSAEAPAAQAAPEPPKAAPAKAKAEPAAAKKTPKAEAAAKTEPAQATKAAAPAKGKKSEAAPAPAPAPAASADIPPPPKKLFGAALKAYEARMRKAMEAAPSQPETAPAAPQASAPAKAASKKGARADAPTEKADAPQNTATAETAKPEKAASQKKSDVKAEDAPKPSIVPVSVTGQKPAVPVRQSVQPDHIVCLEDGEKMKMLKRHLRTSYNMSPEEYKAKWGLPANYPMVAPNYAKQKSLYARKVGLGTHRMRDEVAQKKAVAED